MKLSLRGYRDNIVVSLELWTSCPKICILLTSDNVMQTLHTLQCKRAYQKFDKPFWFSGLYRRSKCQHLFVPFAQCVASSPGNTANNDTLLLTKIQCNCRFYVERLSSKVSTLGIIKLTTCSTIQDKETKERRNEWSANRSRYLVTLSSP